MSGCSSSQVLIFHDTAFFCDIFLAVKHLRKYSLFQSILHFEVDLLDSNDLGLALYQTIFHMSVILILETINLDMRNGNLSIEKMI